MKLHATSGWDIRKNIIKLSLKNVASFYTKHPRLKNLIRNDNSMSEN